MPISIIGFKGNVMTVTNKNKPLYLKYSDKHKKVLIETRNQEDRFCLTVEDAIEACRIYEKQKRASFHEQFMRLLNFLGDWGFERRRKISKVLLTIRDTGLLFLIITKSKTYDEDLENELSELDIKIAQSDNFSSIRLSVMALPLCGHDNYESFCDMERTLEYRLKDADD